MTNTRRNYRSDPLRSIDLAVKDFHGVGRVDKATMKRFDLACLTPVEKFTPESIKRVCDTANMSHALFARALNVTVSLVSKWERGETTPSGPSLKLLAPADRKGIEAIL